jgi:predicted peptidase
VQCFLILILVLSATKATFEPSAEVVQQFQELEYRYSGGRYDDRLFSYRLHTPRTIDGAKRYPILIWLHGGKERGDENRAQLRWMNLVLENMPGGEDDYFVLAAQVPSDVFCWYEAHATLDTNEGRGAPDDMLTIVKAIFDETVLKWPIDVDRVYLAGVSSGGDGCWEMAMRYPSIFAAVAPMASTGGDASRINQLMHVPIWAFHSPVDRPEAVQETVKSLSSAGGLVYFTLVPKESGGLDWLQGHDCWTAAIEDFAVLDWLFKQRRGRVAIPPLEKYTRGTSRGIPEWLNYAVVPGFIGACWATWFIEKRRRAKSRVAPLAMP